MKVKMYNGVKAGDFFYFICYEINLLCRWDICNCKLEIIGAAPEETPFMEGLFGNILFEEGALYLIPFNAKFLWKYEINSSRWIKIELPLMECKEHKFYGAVIKNHFLYLLGYNYPAILKICLNTIKIKVIPIERSLLQDDYIKLGILNGNYYIDNQYLITPLLCNNIILKLDLFDDTLQYIKITGSELKYVGLAFDGNKYWLAPRLGNKYLTWDGKDSFIEKRLPYFITDETPYFGGCYFIESTIIFTSFIGNSIRKDVKNLEDWKEIHQVFLFGKQITKNELILGTNDGEIWWIKENKLQKIKMEIAEGEYRQFRIREKNSERLAQQGTVLWENKITSLKEFLHLV